MSRVLRTGTQASCVWSTNHFSHAIAQSFAICFLTMLLTVSSGSAHAQNDQPSATDQPTTDQPAADQTGDSTGTEASDTDASTDASDANAETQSGGKEKPDELPEIVVESKPDDPEPKGQSDGDNQSAPRKKIKVKRKKAALSTAAAQPVTPEFIDGIDAEGPPSDTSQGPSGGASDGRGEASPGSTLNRGTTGIDGYLATGTSTATKTNTPIKDIPQSINIITKELAQDQGSNSTAEALRFVPGVIVQQGEGHRDQITIRGQETTADFFVDGVRDDIQTFRDLYNAETIEVLKGPNAMIFGRGGGGGIVNRVTKKADGIKVYEGTVQFGSYGRKRVTADVGQALSENFAVRLNAMYEDSETFRDFSELERYGINPTVGIKLGSKTRLHMSYEYKVHDQNVDRGGPSINGVPFEYPQERFFGQPFASFTEFEGHIATATFEHETSFGLQIRNHTFYANYDKLYQNIFSDSAVNAPGPGLVELDGYQNTTNRDSFFNQTDFAYSFNMSSYIRHTVLAGIEIGIQDTSDFRNLPSFDTALSGINSINVPASMPTTFRPVFFDRPSRRRFTELESTSIYIQDQIEITQFLEIIGGIRFERFDLEFENGLDGTVLNRVDEEWSPRIGAVLKPTKDLSLYASYSKSFLPQSGEQFSNLTIDLADLQPEEFENYEIGFKWYVAPRLFLTGALFKLDRKNQRVTVGPDQSAATGLTRTKGGELGLNGYVTDQWQIYTGYANINSKILDAGTNLAHVGNSLESTPRHQFTLWNRYQFNEMFGIGLGVLHQSSWFAEAGNNVEIPGFTRVDGAIYFDLNENWSAQVNVENIFGEDYWISSHNDDNISYGAPTSAYVTIKGKL